MPIVDKTDYQAVERYFADAAQKYERALIRSLQYVAVRVVNTARRRGSYIDQTGNLRSSIGAVIVVDGHISWRSNFDVAQHSRRGKTSDSSRSPITATKPGGYEGRRFAAELARKYSRGVALIVVAGMDYAVHVANRGRDVLDSATLEAKQLVPQMLAKLNAKRK